MSPPQPPQEANDIFSISDQVLADRLQFMEEIGFGNWGSVWLCRPKSEPSSSSSKEGSITRVNEPKIAVKLVHRSKTSTTAARVRSLWNEMKVVRSFKHEPHPSIIPFYSFIITPSYALITMAYHPRLVPVEVPEHHAKEWFRSLLSGVEFLHKRGVVHNDIKPANILLSTENVPILVDFGFAERYDLKSGKAFHSNLSYGTPEYLSPERARGLPHDTRKSDVWSLGITFFEILMGRTPFEYSEGEQFSTKEDLEKYWNRTLRGKWVGSWKMSKAVEKLLRRMVLPNPDLRCTASQAMGDDYWSTKVAAGQTHRKSTSVTNVISTALRPRPSLSNAQAVEPPRILDGISPWTSRNGKGKESSKAPKSKNSKASVSLDKENKRPLSPPGLTFRDAGKGKEKEKERKILKRASVAQSSSSSLSKHARPQSQPRYQSPEPKGASQSRKPGLISTNTLLSNLSPIKHSPPRAPTPAGLLATSFLTLAPSSVTSISRRTSMTAGSPMPSPTTSVFTSSPVRSASACSKENIKASPLSGVSRSDSKSKPTRRPAGPRRPTPPSSPAVNKRRENLTASASSRGLEASFYFKEVSSIKEEDNRTSRVLMDLTVGNNLEQEKEKARDFGSVNGKSKRRDQDRTTAARAKASPKEKENVTKTGSTRSKKKVATSTSNSAFTSDSVRNRMKEWERERERLREMDRLEEKMKEADEERERMKEIEERKRQEEEDRLRKEEEERRAREAEEMHVRELERQKLIEEEDETDESESMDTHSSWEPVPKIAVDEESLRTPPGYAVPTPLSPVVEEPSAEANISEDLSRSGNESGLSILKQSLKMSLDGAVRLYKSSTMALGRSANGTNNSADAVEPDIMEVPRGLNERPSWDDDFLDQEANQQDEANHAERLSTWMKNVEKVSEDARQSFAASSSIGLIPPLPIAPSRSQNSNLNTAPSRERNHRVPRRILPANQIFVDEYRTGELDMNARDSIGPISAYSSELPSPPNSGMFTKSFAEGLTSIPVIPSEEPSRISDAPYCPAAVPQTPSRARRATVVTRSPEPVKQRSSLDMGTHGPAPKRREKSKSQNDLGRPITPITRLEFEIERLANPKPTPTPRLSTVVDPKLFIAENLVPNDDDSVILRRSLQCDDLSTSLQHVEPYPARPASKADMVALDTPAKRAIEGVYDRFLMSTTGVKRNGRGYQSDNGGPISHIASPPPCTKSTGKRNQKAIFTSRKHQMPPPVSSEDWRRSLNADEFGSFSTPTTNNVTASKGDKEGLMRRALRTIVNGKR